MRRFPLTYPAVAILLAALAPLPAAASPPAVDVIILWSVPDGYIDRDGDGYLDPANDPNRVQRRFPVDVDACTGLRPAAPGYRWSVDGRPTSLTGCRFRLTFPSEGRRILRVKGRTRSGILFESIAPIDVEDILIVSIGDSIASGEGNPYRTSQAEAVDSGRVGGVARDGVFENEQCHRSAIGGPAQAARLIERADPHTSVTFVHLACSGASIADDDPSDASADGGLLHPFDGQEPGAILPPQVDEVARIVGPRRIDALTIAAGSNDLKFVDMILNCLANFLGCDEDHPGVPDAVEQFEERFPLLSPRYDALRRALTTKLKRNLKPSGVHVTELYDLFAASDGSACTQIAGGALDEGEIAWARNTVLPALNNLYRAKATAFGWNYVGGIMAGYRSPEGRGYCADDPWVLRGEDSLSNQGDEMGTVHPCARGHALYGDRIAASIVRSLRWAVRLPKAGTSLVEGVPCNSVDLPVA